MSANAVQIKDPNAPASDRQIAYCNQNGIPVTDGMTKAQASALISAYIAEHPVTDGQKTAPATPAAAAPVVEKATARQLAYAQAHNLNITADMTKPEASAIISASMTPEELAAMQEQRRTRLAALAPTEKQLAFVSRVTRGRYTPTNQLQVQGFFSGLRNRRAAAPAAA